VRPERGKRPWPVCKSALFKVTSGSPREAAYIISEEAGVPACDDTRPAVQPYQSTRCLTSKQSRPEETTWQVPANSENDVTNILAVLQFLRKRGGVDTLNAEGGCDANCP
jgi:hypothetical protein